MKIRINYNAEWANVEIEKEGKRIACRSYGGSEALNDARNFAAALEEVLGNCERNEKELDL